MTRSRTGCLTCRKRKLKCDEVRPICGQCSKASRECVPSDGITFRHQQNASMNGKGLESFYAYKNTFSDDHVWLDIPNQVTFINVKDPYSEYDTPESGLISPVAGIRPLHGRHMWSHQKDNVHSPSYGLDTLSSIATSDSFSLTPTHDTPGRSYIQSFRTPPGSRPTTGHNPMEGIQSSSDDDNNTLQGPTTPINATNRLMHVESAHLQAPEGFRDSPDDEHEIVFLMRHYAEVPGKGMDLFDVGRYFSYHVPVKAQNDPLLQAAACAYAAKQIARSGGVNTYRKGIQSSSMLARMEVWPDPSSGAGKVQWESIGQKYYTKAIGYLARALAEKRHWPESGSTQTSPDATPPMPMKPPRTSDELLAATAILCEYEAMDANGVWQKHLAGTKSLLDVAEVGMRPSDGLPDIHNEPKFAGARKAIFWNFARQDFAAAFITECQARLDCNNHEMWRAAGLELDSQGHIIPNSVYPAPTPFDSHSREDMLANSLILLLSKMNNYIVRGESFWPAGPGHQGPRHEDLMEGIDHVGISQQTLLERWSEISREVDTWHSNLPDTFHLRMTQKHDVFSEIWYSIPMCASAMQAWHMAKIILLINMPHETTARRTTIATRLRSYKDITAKIDYHAREICGISLARPAPSVRIFSIQPLFVAGSCFIKKEEQDIVMDLLEAIERELGWKTDYRRKKLRMEWGWEPLAEYADDTITNN